jgi:hypothetical protein
MAIDLFSIVLEGVGSWVIGRMLDSMVGCGRCGHTVNETVTNYESSNLICPRCNNVLDQYTNATDHTVNRNGSIAAAYVSNIHWEKWGNLWTPNFNPHFDVNAVNSKYQDLVVRCSLSEFQGSTFFEGDLILRPQNDRTSWNGCSWKIPPNTFPAAGGTFAMDVYVFNTWGDELHRARSLGTCSSRSEESSE